MHEGRAILPGSAPPGGGGWLRRGPSRPDAEVGVTLYLREDPSGPSLEERVALGRGSGHPGRHLTYSQLARAHGPAAGDLAAVRRFAGDSGLRVGPVNAAACSVELSGRIGDLNRAFGVELCDHVHPHALRHGRAPVHRSHQGPVRLPAILAEAVRAVTGLSDRPLARTHLVAAAPRPEAADTGTSPSVMAAAYGVPPGSAAPGQTVGILSLGGGYTHGDLDTFCAHPSVAVPSPAIIDVSVHGGRNAPTNGGDPDTADGEVALDLQTVAAVAPGAGIRVYFAPNTERGFVDSLARAVRDGCSVISISWGAPEALWPVSAMLAVDRTCQAALAMGVSVFCSSGDAGSGDGLHDQRSHADFPASSPHTVACGGTAMPLLDTTRETAWNDLASGGGAGGGAVSDVWPLPPFQRGAHPPRSVNDGRRRRTTPDLAANASPASGYRVLVGGEWQRMGGTSAVAPMLAGMAALINAELARRHPGARLGDFNAALYSHFAPAGALHDIADGSTNGGHYFARPGFDAVTGWGSPDYSRMLELSLAILEEEAAARRPGTRVELDL